MTAREATRLMQLNILKHVEKKRGCWVWVGPTSWSSRAPERKYGYLTDLRGNRVAARRASYEAFGNLPKMRDRVVGCSCSNRLCVNPKHLYLKDQGKSTGRNGKGK